MKVEFNESFLKDLNAVKDKSVLSKVKAAIESVEQADSLDKITNLKKKRGSREYFRLRIGDFRVGLTSQGRWFLSGASTAKTSTGIFRDLRHRNQCHRPNERRL